MNFNIDSFIDRFNREIGEFQQQQIMEMEQAFSDEDDYIQRELEQEEIRAGRAPAWPLPEVIEIEDEPVEEQAEIIDVDAEPERPLRFADLPPGIQDIYEMAMNGEELYDFRDLQNFRRPLHEFGLDITFKGPSGEEIEEHIPAGEFREIRFTAHQMLQKAKKINESKPKRAHH